MYGVWTERQPIKLVGKRRSAARLVQHVVHTYGYNTIHSSGVEVDHEESLQTCTIFLRFTLIIQRVVARTRLPKK